MLAWTINRTDKNHRGRAMSTTYNALAAIVPETGIGISTLVAGWLYGHKADNISLVYWLWAIMASGAFIYLQLNFKS